MPLELVLAIIGLVITTFGVGIQLRDRRRKAASKLEDAEQRDQHQLLTEKHELDASGSQEGPPAVLLPPSVADVIYEGRGGTWSDILNRYREEKGSVEISAQELQVLVISYDIARARQVAHRDGDIIFFDSSWLSHGPGFWNHDPQMQRWFRVQADIAHRRAQAGRRTIRVFYWRPENVGKMTELLEMFETIMAHLTSGILVYLVHPEQMGRIVDAQVWTSQDALESEDFADWDIRQLHGRAETSKVVDRFRSVESLAHRGGAVHFALNTPRDAVLQVLAHECPHLQDHELV